LAAKWYANISINCSPRVDTIMSIETNILFYIYLFISWLKHSFYWIMLVEWDDNSWDKSSRISASMMLK
jgi:hypothetical protein